MKPHVLLLLATLWGLRPLVAAERVEFARDVLPILSANCFPCHGPDEHDRQAGLRLDGPQHISQSRKSGVPVVPGKPAESLIWQRVETSDPDAVMPPPSSNKVLKPAQVELIRRWITEGGGWQRHWAFEPVRRPPGTLDDQVRQGLASLPDAGVALTLRPRARPETLVRRLALDVTGLPPSLDEVEAFAANPSDQAWEELVDRLLARPQFGEHWARMWLDLARHADTKGYEKDLGRTVWPWRDWVVRALNADLPLGEFTERQLAGDLRDNPSVEDLVATAFHRNTMSNDEGGTDDEEFRVAAVKDRVDTTVQVWMGLTMGCSKCHSHKYDPISQADYYRFYAIFNQTEDADRFDDHPRLELPSPEQQERRQELQQQVERRQGEMNEARRRQEEQELKGEGPWRPLVAKVGRSEGNAVLTPGDNAAISVTGPKPEKDVYVIEGTLAAGRHTALRIEAVPSQYPDGQQGLGRNPADPNFVLSELHLDLLADGTATRQAWGEAKADFSQQGWPVAAAIDGDLKTGWAVSPRSRETHVAQFELRTPLVLASETPVRITISQQYGNSLLLARFRLWTSEVAWGELTLPMPSPEVELARQSVAEAQQRLQQLAGEIPQLPVLKELSADRRRVTRIHNRGNFLDVGDEVQPAIPAGFGPVPPTERPTRTDVARWLVNDENPLTPRVWANRIWARLHGIGLVETEEDFGALGSWPVNAPLLDWLAAEYRDQGWSLKKLLRAIVLSEAYRQESETTETLRQVDPQNRWLSRGARYRLSAEVLRDQALAVSGLLSLKQGGPPVMPPQPAGLWRSTYNGRSWIDAEGEDRYRRGLYTYLKRTTPYPSFVMFDGGSGEVCQIRRVRTNTPLQALVTLNDPVYLEAAGGLANRVLTVEGPLVQRLQRGMSLAMLRAVSSAEVEPLARLHARALARFELAPEEAETLVKAARLPPGDIATAEAAAWIVVSSAILNLDEFLTRN
ncbi:MAG: PSD1 and planctomycete cytochrome C domain-containing protein [Planctomycetaceae bacterium]